MKIVKALLLSIAISAVICAILLSAMALVVTKSGTLPTELLPVLVTVISCIAVFAGSVIASAATKEKGIVLGVLSGSVFALITALVSVLVFKNDFNIGSAGKLFALLLSGAIGGILGANKKSKVKF